MITTPEVTVILPVHGDAPHLGETLESLLNQAFENWELLIILDRPSRLTEDFSARAAGRDSRIKVHKSKQPGLVAALNMGISESSAPLIARIDADDLMRPDRLEKQLEKMANTPNLVCLGSQIAFIDVEGQLVGASKFPNRPKQVRLALPATNCIAHPSVVVRKSAVEKVGGYLENLDGVEDYHLWLKLLQVGDVANHPEQLTLYRLHPNQMSRKNEVINGHLESLARIDVFSVMKPLSQGPWAEQLTTMTKAQRAVTIGSLEDSLPLKTRMFLRANRNLSYFLRETGFSKVGPLIVAFLCSPARTLLVVSMLFTLYRINPMRRQFFGSHTEEKT